MLSKGALAAVWLVTLFGVEAAPQVAGKCSGQSCYTALLAGTTGEPYKQQGRSKPSGGNASGDRCIKGVYKELGLPPPEGIRFVDTQSTFEAAAAPYSLSVLEAQAASMKERRALLEAEIEQGPSDEEYLEYVKRFESAEEHEELNETETGDLEKRQGACKPNTLLFGRGTTEIGTMGTTVGPALSAALGSSWATEGINYSADLPGIYCLGMQGGQKCVKQLERLSTRCPNTKIVLSGYSQGAMVARFCVAWANEKARSQVVGIATFGDPFNGAPVKGFPQEKIKVWCNKGDGVCNGQFSIGAAHLGYVGGSTSAAVTWIKSLGS